MSWSRRYPQINAADIQHRLAQLINFGKVVEVDYKEARVRVQMGEWKTTWLPWITQRSSNDFTWWAPEIDEQVLILAPSGDLAQGIVLTGIFQKGHADVVSDIAPDKRDSIQRVKFQDGTQIEYNRDLHLLKADIKGDVEFTVDKDVTGKVKGNVDLDVDGNVKVKVGGDVKANIKGNLTADVVKDATLKAKNIQLDASAKLTLKAGADMTLKAGGQMKLNAAHISAQE